MIKINTDASTHPKYQVSAGCFIIKKEGQTIVETFPLDATDNHIAEFQTMILALEYCLQNNWQKDLIFIYSDSSIVVKSFHKRYVKKDIFLPLLSKLLILSQGFSDLTIEWIPQESNKMADHHAKQALKKELKRQKKSPK